MSFMIQINHQINTQHFIFLIHIILYHYLYDPFSDLEEAIGKDIDDLDRTYLRFLSFIVVGE